MDSGIPLTNRQRKLIKLQRCYRPGGPRWRRIQAMIDKYPPEINLLRSTFQGAHQPKKS